MKAFILPLCALLTACGGGGSAPTEAPAAPAQPAVPAQPAAPAQPAVLDCTVDLYGDSIMAGTYLAGGETPAMMFRRMRTKYTVHDYAVGGQKATVEVLNFTGGTSRFVVLEWGANDGGAFARGEPVGDYKAAMRSMVQLAQARGHTVVVTGLNRQQAPLAWVDDYNAMARAVASETGAVFADWHSVAPGDFYDFTHPEASYSQDLMVQLIKTLDRLAPECS